MYPAVTSSADFAREVHQGGPACDKVSDMWSYLESASCEELNRHLAGAKSFSVMRHALGDLMEDLVTPVPMLNPSLKKGLDQFAKRLPGNA